jgi:isoamylase
MNRNIWPGEPFPLGATFTGEGVNFALYSENATAVELCLFKSTEGGGEERIRVMEMTNHVWHCFLPGVKPGQLYGYRVHGPYEPRNGHRFNPNKLLLDPYAKAISGTIDWSDAMFGYQMGHEDGDLSFSETDSAPNMPKSIVIDPSFDWEGDTQLRLPYHRTIVYETHVKGFTKLHPDIPEDIRGTYAAIAHPVTIQYLKDLGITAIELLPIHHFITDRHLADKGLTNNWGYNSIGFFAPDVRYHSGDPATGGQVQEFKQMVKELHRSGIEVILDVVYNHTGEGNHMGPTVCFRGVDNMSYYRLTQDKRYYNDYTGTGNTLNTVMPPVLRLIMDSLRYWITEMHIDGFRFDLASTLARELHAVDRLGSFFDIIHQDPLISQVKLIAEPWDVGEGGYMVGNFPPGWAEWNGKYRDCMRDYWRGEGGVLSEFAERFTGSSDLYKDDYRKPQASINFITAHDGFTLNDLVSYNEKYNIANGEDNNDGESHNRSWNCGAEGLTNDAAVHALRKKQKRNFLTTLFLSQGVPMLLAGDELSHSQGGNNNAYCQDNEISWLQWPKADHELLQYTQKLISFYKAHPAFSRKRWFKGRPIKGVGLEDIAWFQPSGDEMTDENWNEDHAKALAVYLNGKGLRMTGPKGEPVVDDSFFVIFNASHLDLEYMLPPERFASHWRKVIDTTSGVVHTDEEVLGSGQLLKVSERSVVVLMGV